MANQVDYQLIFKCLPGWFYVLKPDFTFVAASDAFYQGTRTNENMLTGKYLFDIFPENPEEKNARGEITMRDSLAYVIQHKEPHTMAVLKYDIRTPDGAYDTRYWSPLNQPVINNQGEVVYIIHQVKDITDLMKVKEESASDSSNYQLREMVSEREAELYQRAQEIQRINADLIREVRDRKAAENESREVHNLLRTTVESHKDLLFFSIDRGYRYLIFNVAFQLSTWQAYGTNVEEGMNMLDSITNENDRARAKANCDKAFAGEAHVVIDEYGDLHRFYFETRYTPILDKIGNVTGVSVQSSNITDRKRAEEQRRLLNEELESFTYSVAHDLRAPLRAISNYSSILLEDHSSQLDAEGRRLLDVSVSSAKLMGRLIEDLLHFSRIGKLSVRQQPIDMNEVVRRVIGEKFPSLEKSNITLTLNQLDPIKCDSEMMEQVFANLISNAIKYSSKKDKPVITISSEKENGEIIYAVRDNGVGFDMKYAGKLFGVFTRLHKVSEFEGTGVGLAVAHRIVTKHGGRIWAEAEVDRGATFYFAIPVLP